MSFESNGMNRLEEAKRWISNRLNLPEETTARFYGIHTNLFQSDPDALQPVGGDSTLVGALKKLQTQSNELPGAVVLISDGADRTGADAEEVSLDYRKLNIPVFTVLVGESDSQADLMIEDVFSPSTLGDNSMVPLKGKLRATGFVGKSVPVQVMEGERLVAEKRIKIEAEEMEFDFEFYPGRDGFRNFEILIPPQPGERTEV